MKYLFILLLLLSSCKSLPKKITVSTLKDSIRTEIRYKTKDTLITIPGDSVKISVPVFDLTETPIVRRSNMTTARISRIGDDIHVECLTDEYIKIIELQNQVIETFREIRKERQETITIPKRYVPKIIQLLAWLGVILLIAVGGIVVLKIKKLI